MPHGERMTQGKSRLPGLRHSPAPSVVREAGAASTPVTPFRDTGRGGRSDRLPARCTDPVAGGDLGGEFIVAAAEIPDEGMPGGQGPGGTVLGSNTRS